MKHLKIFIVCSDLSKETVLAQPWRYSFDLSQNLLAKGHEVTLITDNQSVWHRMNTMIYDTPVIVLPKIRRLLSSMTEPSQMRKLIQQSAPDVVYWNGSPQYGAYLKQFSDIKPPIVLHINSNLFSFGQLSLTPREYLRLSYRLYFLLNTPLMTILTRSLNDKSIDLITVPNKAIKETLVQNGVLSEKVQILPIPFHNSSMPWDSPQCPHFRTREKLGIEENEFVAAYFGPPHTYRGTDTIIHAVAKLKSKLPNIKVLMLLRTTEKEKSNDEFFLRRLVSKMNLHNNIHFISGVLPKRDLIELLQLSDVIVFPFKILFSEPPLTVLEAMSLGKPIVTTRVSGLPELVEPDHGLSVKPNDPVHLADTLYYLERNPRIRRLLGNRAQNYVSTLPSWAEFSDNFMRFLS